MTIKVEQEALVALQSQHWPIVSEDDCLLLQRKPLSSQDFRVPVVEKLRHSLSSDDEDSVFTLSTASLSDTDSEFDRRVSFADDMVTEVWTRPYTPKEDVSKLYYSTEETQRFRQDYRMERKLLSTLTSELSIDPDTVDNEDLSLLLASTNSPVSGRHRSGISRVVVLHNDKLETFCNPEETSIPDLKGVPDDFFDTPEFWSGSITWW
jgi:hypothetical protein